MKKQLWGKILVVIAAIGLSACGDGMIGAGTSQGSGVGSTGDLEPKLDIAAIESELVTAEAALKEAEVALDSALSGGPSEPSMEGVSAKSLTGLPERLREALNKVYDKLTIPVQKAKAGLANARLQLASAMAKLDPKNPAYAEMIAKLQEAMLKLDGLESRFTGIYKALALKIDVVLAGVDQLISRASSSPWLFLVVMELEEVREVILEFQDRLANT